MSLFLVGGYTAEAGGSALGVGLAATQDDGRLRFLGTVAVTGSPSWTLVLGDRLHVVDESAGEVVSFARSDAGLAEIGRVAVDGDSPCHLEPTPGGVLASCYGTGTASLLPFTEDGALRPPAQRIEHRGSGPHPDQASARAHAGLALPDGRVLIADLGADLVSVHGWRDGGLAPLGELRLPAGTGPRDLTLLADGRVLLLGELDSSLHLLDPDDEVPTLVASVQLNGARERTHAAGIAVDESTGRVYVGLRRANRIAVARIFADELTAEGDVDCGGDWPRHLVLHDGRLHVANQLSNEVASFAVDAAGLPQPLGAPVPMPSPTHLLPLHGRGWEGLASFARLSES